MLGISKANSSLTVLGPNRCQACAFLPSCQGQIEWIGGISGPIPQGFETGDVFVPLLSHGRHRGEEFLLLTEGGLLVIGADQK